MPRSLEPSRKSSPTHLNRSQGSPATVGSASSRQIISPVVRVESFEDETTQSLSKMTSKRSHPSRKSNTHLSPYPADSDDSDDEGSSHSSQPRSVPGIQRQDDGSWVGNASGQSGLAPQARDQIRDMEVPTLDEIHDKNKLEKKKAEVEDWLDHSEVGSEAEVLEQASIPQGKRVNRRRAKSTNDLGYFSQSIIPNVNAVPGPGLKIDVPSDNEEDEEAISDSELESPPANVHMQNADSYFPSEDSLQSLQSLQSGPIPWADPPGQAGTQDKRYQPPTSNAAMMRFKQRAKDVESASLAATLGSSHSRRRSESDMESVLTAKGISKEITNSDKSSKQKHSRTGSFFDNLRSNLGRSNSSQKKRKGTITSGQQNDSASGTSTPKEGPTLPPSGVKRIGSWGKPKSPMLDTSPATLNVPPVEGNTPTAHSPTTPWGIAKERIRRSRSKSDIGRSRSKSDTGRSPGLGDLMTQFGGPPMPKLASPINAAQAMSNLSTPAVGLDGDDDSGDEGGALQGGILMDLAVRSDPVIPTHGGFKAQARQLNPRIPEFLLERITQEQIKRYQRLLGSKGKHLAAVQGKNCSAGAFCFALGGSSKQHPPKQGNKDTDTPFVGFQIISPGTSAEKLEKDSDGTIIAAQFPSGVPLPPVERLPAEFECPLCFKVKKFYKPSDWTKHVHEDVQPFTCTFPNCNEPKSFKRKADWVRHENERHRQLENWTCDMGECVHTCYRKDNFVQHLVREHKIPEPKVRNGRSNAASRSPNTPLNPQGWTTDDPFGTSLVASAPGNDDIWAIVDRCRRDTTKQPGDECCRFCGNICNTWKKLTVHLAKHMEQISMPILPLVKQRQMDAGSISTSIEVPQVSQAVGPVLSDSPQDLPTFLTDEPSSLDLGDLSIGQSYSSLAPGIAVNGAMHTYPPAPYVMQRIQQQPQQNAFAQPQAQNLNFPIQSYPPPFIHSRSSSTHTSIPTSSPNKNYQFPTSAANYTQQFPTTPGGGLNIQNQGMQNPHMQGQYEQSFHFMTQAQGYQYGGNQQYSGA
ncbi:hypothetical protein NA57DRAFT_65592 [Rhizodiscina lignyota]|uniref:C2H2-type domain-containing protein n=1 Tax=Rhizodiscina lignyota TaxID=1504668 RepID=A0A9P4IHU7_9PEZI|nr:hypothetical protein NA57DRAFT_65592 [Rhizodiscina lignyota]